MVKRVNLIELNALKTDLLNTVSRKIASSKTSTINSDINKLLKIEIPTISSLLDSLECKLRECEIVFHSYLESPDHALLCGYGSALPVVLNLEFSYGTNIMKKDIEINDKVFYKEIIDSNFRHFILLTAALYENIVFLSELLLKKIIVHLPEKRPLSSPLHDYVAFLKTLIGLGYRQHDHIYACVLASDPFFSNYLPTINLLRNRFIHGFQVNLANDGSNYKIVTFLAPFSAGSPDLDIDIFSKKVLSESRTFILAVIAALIRSIKHHSKIIPA